MRKLIAALVAAALLAAGAPAFADEAYPADPAQIETASVIVNGKLMEFDTEPYIINGRTVVPMRAIFEELGAEVEWIEESSLILATKGYKLVSMKIDSSTMYIADVSRGISEEVALDVAPFLNADGNRTLVPLRAVSEAFDAEVLWDEATSTVTITVMP